MIGLIDNSDAGTANGTPNCADHLGGWPTTPAQPLRTPKGFAKSLLAFFNESRRGRKIRNEVRRCKPGGLRKKNDGTEIYQPWDITVTDILRDWFFDGVSHDSPQLWRAVKLTAENGHIRRTKFRQEQNNDNLYTSASRGDCTIYFIDIDCHEGQTDAQEYADHINAIMDERIYWCESARGMHGYILINRAGCWSQPLLKMVSTLYDKFYSPKFQAKLEIRNPWENVWRIPLIKDEAHMEDWDWVEAHIWNFVDLQSHLNSKEICKMPIRTNCSRPYPYHREANLRNHSEDELNSPDAWERTNAAAKKYYHIKKLAGQNPDEMEFVDFYERVATFTGDRDLNRISRCARALRRIVNNHGGYIQKSSDAAIAKYRDRIDLISIKEYAKYAECSHLLLEKCINTWIDLIQRDMIKESNTPQAALEALGYRRTVISAAYKLLIDKRIIKCVKEFNRIEHRARKLATIEVGSGQAPIITNGPSPRGSCSVSGQLGRLDEMANNPGAALDALTAFLNNHKGPPNGKEIT